MQRGRRLPPLAPQLLAQLEPLGCCQTPTGCRVFALYLVTPGGAVRLDRSAQFVALLITDSQVAFGRCPQRCADTGKH